MSQLQVAQEMVSTDLCQNQALVCQANAEDRLASACPTGKQNGDAANRLHIIGKRNIKIRTNDILAINLNTYFIFKILSMKS